jgi:hypothetical protein
MTKKNSPYKGYTVEEVSTMEKSCFCVVLGGDFVQEDGIYLFTKKEADRLYKIYLKNLLSLIKTGEEKDRTYALDLLPGLIIRPLKVQ